VLAELGAGDKTMITVFNKIDAATPRLLAGPSNSCPTPLRQRPHRRRARHPGGPLPRAHRRRPRLDELLIPHDRYDVVARLHATATSRARSQRDDGVRLFGRYPPAQAAFFAPFVVK
jgi:GTP-binding protein HflX